jgi:hypothetical protein
MAFNISEFTSQINKYGLAVNNLFIAQFTLPKSLSLFGSGFGNRTNMETRDIPFFCRSVQLPDLEVGVTDVKEQGHGVSQKRATAMENGVVPVVFMIDANFSIKKLFHQWNQSIFNHGNGDGPLAQLDSRKLYEFNYKDDYSSVLEITVFSHNNTDQAYTYKFFGAFPVSVGGVQSAWENGAEIMTMTVNFAFDSFYVDGAVGGDVLGTGLEDNGFVGFLSSINSTAQQIKQIRKKPRDVQDLVTQTNNVGRILQDLPF